MKTTAIGLIAKLLDFVLHNILCNIVFHNSLKKVTNHIMNDTMNDIAVYNTLKMVINCLKLPKITY